MIPAQGIYEDSNWWRAKENGQQAHVYLMDLVQSLRDKQATRYDNFFKLQSIYEWGYKATYYTGDRKWGNGNQSISDVPIQEDVLAYNAAANVIDTVHAKVTKTKIAPMPLTSGGNYIQRSNAKKLGQALDGEFAQNDVEAVKDDVVKEALINGTGIAKVFSQWGRIKIEAVPAEDITFDDGEGRYRTPRCMYHTQFVDRFVLLQTFGDDGDDLEGDPDARKRAILSAPSVTLQGDQAGTHDQIKVTEAYHLPSRPVEYDDEGDMVTHDGRHVICIDGCTLMDTPWNRNTFPFALYTPVKRRRSVWGLSMMHKLASGEREFEKLTTKIQVAHHRMGGSHFIASRQANLEATELSNALGDLIQVDGPASAVQVFNPDPVSPQTYQYASSIPDNMMRFMGVSPLSAQQQIPAGLSNASGKALQVYEDFESERLVAYHRGIERWILDLAQLIILEARDITKVNPDYKVRFQAKKSIQSVKWKDVLLDEDDFVLDIFPVSMLSKTPAAKFQQLQELLNSGAITLDQFKRLFEMPDLEAENELDTADVDIIDKMLDLIVLKGEDIQPQPFDDLNMAVGRTRKFINLCRVNDVPEEIGRAHV